MRLIDADALINSFDMSDFDNVDPSEDVGNAINIVYSMPTVDPVKHGKWIKTDSDDGGHYCSVCKFGPHGLNANHKFGYCPYCGAKMDLEGQHGNQ